MYIAEGNVEKGITNNMQSQVIAYLMNKKGYDEKEAWLTYGAWAQHNNLVYGIPPYRYTEYIDKYRKMVGLPPMDWSKVQFDD